MSLRMPEDSRTVDALIDQTRNSRAIVVLHFCDPSAGASTASAWDEPSWEGAGGGWSSGQTTLSGAIVERVANEYSTSQLYGGAPLVVLQIDADMPEGQLICAQRQILSFPTLQVWHSGLCEEVIPGELEQKLRSLGVASKGKASPLESTTGTATFESDYTAGTGLPSATAVDEIDFTGGRPLATNRDGTRGMRNRMRPDGQPGTTRDFFPGPQEGKPGDNMNDDGTPGGPGEGGDSPFRNPFSPRGR